MSEIRVVFSNDNGNYLLSVDDDGVPEENRETIFDAFTRLDASRDRDTGGFGLGLSIAQRISQNHGGKISVKESSLGGASFVIFWPETQSINKNQSTTNLLPIITSAP